MLMWVFSSVYISSYKWYRKKKNPQLSVLVKLPIVNVQNKVSRGRKINCINALFRQQNRQPSCDSLPHNVPVFQKCRIWCSTWVSGYVMLECDRSFPCIIQLSKTNILKYICVSAIFRERNRIIFFSMQWITQRLCCQRKESRLHISG